MDSTDARSGLRAAQAPDAPSRRPDVWSADRWQAAAAAHAERADELTAAHRARRAEGRRHPVEDFLFEYYPVRPSALRRWHPGADVALAPGPDGPAPHAAWRWYRTGDDGVVSLDVAAFLEDRGDGVRHMHALLAATASRAPATGCFGMHEWAMVYRQDDAARRHSLPLRLGRDGTDAVVEGHTIRCTHVDAFRFFTPEAAPRNTVQPTRATQVRDEQPGCLHVSMDLLRYALKLGPAVPGDLLLDCFELARAVRVLDMRASPYDVTSLGHAPVAVETPEGKRDYVAAQRAFAERAAPLRARLVGACRSLTGADAAASGTAT